MYSRKSEDIQLLLFYDTLLNSWGAKHYKTKILSR